MRYVLLQRRITLPPDKVFKRKFRVPTIEISHFTRIEYSGDINTDNKRDVYPKYSDAKGIESYQAVYYDGYCEADFYGTARALNEIVKLDDVEVLDKKEPL